MKMLKHVAVAAFFAFASSTAMMAQESSYTPGSVWNSSRIKVMPGQFETYMDWLKGNWKVRMDALKKEGNLISYHVLAVNNARHGEPDLILVTQSKDYLTTAQQLALEKKIDALMASDSRKDDTASGERKVMRELMGTMQMQELNLK
jgi:hypothetical protein